MQQARAALDAAAVASRTPVEAARVKLAADCFAHFTDYMTLRHDLTAGKLADLDADAKRWLARRKELRKAYEKNAAFDPFGEIALPDNVYPDASRVARDFAVISQPIAPWRFRLDKEKVGERQGWYQANYDDAAWKITDPSTETWADLGLFEYCGSAWYRATVQAPAIPAGKKVYLWISMVDDRCRLYVNGQPVPYITAKGESVPNADGYLTAFSFDITAALHPGAANQITLFTTRTTINEIGTGGLMGPVLLFREK